MLVELRDVEVYVEPEEILTKALEEGDLSVDTVVRECIINDGVEDVLDSVDNSDITAYCEKHNIMDLAQGFEMVMETVPTITQEQKAQLLWLLLKG